jgi:hypothetical protein
MGLHRISPEYSPYLGKSLVYLMRPLAKSGSSLIKIFIKFSFSPSCFKKKKPPVDLAQGNRFA